jgi:hypothetical protein
MVEPFDSLHELVLNEVGLQLREMVNGLCLQLTLVEKP